MIQRSFGYTLIELLVVLLIISIIAGSAMLSLGHSQNKRLEQFTVDTLEYLTLAEEEAMLKQKVLGLKIGPDEMVFMLYQSSAGNKKGQWVAYADKLLNRIPIPDNMIVRFKSVEERQETETLIPDIIIAPNGSLTPFTLYFGKTEAKPRYALIGKEDGTIYYQALNT